MAGFKSMMLESELLTEAFDSKPYEYTMGKKGAGDVFFTFEDESGKEFRVQFYTSGGLGKEVRRVYVGERIGSVYKDAIRKFADPLRVISTVIAATEEYLRTPIGMKVKGLAFDLSKQAAPRGERVMRMIMKRSQIIKKRIDVLDSNLVIDSGRTIIWTVRKGEDPAKVYNGPKVDGLLGSAQVDQAEQVRKGVSSSGDFQKEVATLLLGSEARKEMTGSYSGAYAGQFRVVVDMGGSVEASKDGYELMVFEPKPGETAKNYAGRVAAGFADLVGKFKKGLWQKGLGRFEPDPASPNTLSGPAAEIVSKFSLVQTENPSVYSGELVKEINHEWWLEVDLDKNGWSIYHYDTEKAFGPINSRAIATINDNIKNLAGELKMDLLQGGVGSFEKPGVDKTVGQTAKEVAAQIIDVFNMEQVDRNNYKVDLSTVLKGNWRLELSTMFNTWELFQSKRLQASGSTTEPDAVDQINQKIQKFGGKPVGGIAPESSADSITFEDSIEAHDRAAAKFLASGMSPKRVAAELANIGWGEDWYTKAVPALAMKLFPSSIKVAYLSNQFMVQVYVNKNTNLLIDIELGKIAYTDIIGNQSDWFGFEKLEFVTREWVQTVISGLKNVEDLANAQLEDDAVQGLSFKAELDLFHSYAKIVSSSPVEDFDGEMKFITKLGGIEQWAKELVEMFNATSNTEYVSLELQNYHDQMSAHPDVDDAEMVSDGVYWFEAYGVAFTAEDGDNGIEIQVQDDDGEVVVEFMSQGVERDLGRVKAYSDVSEFLEPVSRQEFDIDEVIEVNDFPNQYSGTFKRRARNFLGGLGSKASPFFRTMAPDKVVIVGDVDKFSKLIGFSVARFIEILAEGLAWGAVPGQYPTHNSSDLNRRYVFKGPKNEVVLTSSFDEELNEITITMKIQES